MNTHYPHNNSVFGTGKLGIDYAQLILAPTIAYRVLPNQSIGLSILLGAQRIKLYGLQNFKNFSTHPGHVTNKGYNYDVGIGARIGWIGEIFEGFWLGAAYATKTYMTKNQKYKGLLAGEKLDIPANLSVGLKYELTPCMNVAFDFQHIYYRNVRAVGNSISKFIPGTLGKKNAAGFGWKNISAYKVGIDYAIDPCFKIRAGYAISQLPYSKREIDFNIIAPAVVTSHYTVGLTYVVNDSSEWDIAYSYSPKGQRRGVSNFGLGNVKHEMYQHLLEINYAWK